MIDQELVGRARRRAERLREHLEVGVGEKVRLVETHISFVLLAGTLAYKLKKPVRLPFLDFTTLDMRRCCAREELRVNRRLAPSLYLDVVDVVETAAGPRFGGRGAVVDVALRMRRFPDGALWSERVGRGKVTYADIDALAASLASFHAKAQRAPATSRFGSAQQHARVVADLLAALPADDPTSAELRAWLPLEVQRLAGHFEARRLAGRVVEAHGDLHLANVVQLGETPTAFDAIEFDETLRWIDPMEDLAFLVMDLLAHDAEALAWRCLNAWLAASGDYEGLAALRLHLACRALVRAQVGDLCDPALRSPGTAPPSSSAYRALAARLSRSDPPRLAITHGLPGSGKTVAARALSEANGAVLVRSDVERKRLYGLSALDRSGAAAMLYTAEATERTYARLLAVAGLALSGGWSVIIDAAFLRHAERAAFLRLAADAHIPFAILACSADLDVLRARVRVRLEQGADASEADESVLERLACVAEALDASERVYEIVVDSTRPGDVRAWKAQWWVVPPVEPLHAEPEHLAHGTAKGTAVGPNTV